MRNTEKTWWLAGHEEGINSEQSLPQTQMLIRNLAHSTEMLICLVPSGFHGTDLGRHWRTGIMLDIRNWVCLCGKCCQCGSEGFTQQIKYWVSMAPFGWLQDREAGAEEADVITVHGVIPTRSKLWTLICDRRDILCDRRDILCPKMRSGLGSGRRRSPELPALRGGWECNPHYRKPQSCSPESWWINSPYSQG